MFSNVECRLVLIEYWTMFIYFVQQLSPAFLMREPNTLISLLTLSTDPCDWGCLGLPWIILQSGHFSLTISARLAFLNSLPLSLCRIWGAPNKQNISTRLSTTSWADLWRRGRSTMNLVRWSWYTIGKLNGLLTSSVVCKSIKSTWPLEAKSELRIGLVTVLFNCFLHFCSWHSLQEFRYTWITSLENPQYCCLRTENSLSLLRCFPPSVWTLSNRSTRASHGTTFNNFSAFPAAS